MTKLTNPEPSSVPVKTGVSAPKDVAEALSGALADTYSLLIKTHAVHWNVEGPMFFAVHNLTEAQYNDLFEATDVIAERIRALGQLTAMSPSALLKDTVVGDVKAPHDAVSLCESLAEDHAKVAKRLHEVIKISGDANDPVTEDLATGRSAFHEKAAWMLRALAAQ